MKMEQIECPETSVYKLQTPGNHPEENIQHTEHGESLKSKSLKLFLSFNIISLKNNTFIPIYSSDASAPLSSPVAASMV
jgi:hypothetical protein